MKTALILCPCFTRGKTPPLGLASLSAVMKRAGHVVLPFDIDFMLASENIVLSDSIYRHTFIGYEDRHKVNFITNPNLVFQSLFASKKKMATRLSAEEIPLVQLTKLYVKKYVDLILQNDPDAVFFSTYIGNLWFSLLTAQAIKKKHKQIKVVFGGPGCGLREVQDIILRFGFVDICVVGEGEETIIELCQCLENGQKFNGIQGISILEKGIVSCVPRKPIRNLDTLPYPDFDDFPYPGFDTRQDYPLNSSCKGADPSASIGTISISASRGCVMRCAFCSESSYWGIFRHKSVDSLVCEIKYQIKKYGCKRFYFCDSLVNFDPVWLNDFCDKLLKENIEVKFFFAYFRAKGLSSTLLRKIAKVGFCNIGFGVESGSQDILNLMRKGTDIAEIKKILVWTSRYGIQWSTGILGGFPGETREDVKNTIKFIRDINNSISKEAKGQDPLPPWLVAPIRLEPYSRMYNTPNTFKISFEHYKIQIPSRIRHLEPFISKILLLWKSELDPKELDYRMQLLSNAIREDAVMKG